jgi:hypothetical protein
MPTINGHFGPISQNQDPNLWAPLISVSLAKYQPAPTNSVPLAPAPTVILQNNVTALVDTGSQGTLIDRGIAENFSLQQGHGGSGLFLGRELPSPSYLTTLWFPEILFWFTGDLISGVFADVPFKIILGWDFLHRVNLILERKNNVVRLDWVGE